MTLIWRRRQTQAQTLPISESSPSFDVMAFMEKHGHELLLQCRDAETGLRALIALHDTRLGPGLGGTRIKQYPNNAEGEMDVLRLAEGMTYKAAIAGLPFGGGKAVILADGKENDINLRAARFRAFGRFVDSLSGQYITTEDSGTGPADMREIRATTRFVVGTPREDGGGGDPSPTTAYGLTRAMQALVEDILHRDTLQGTTVAIQGLGHVGMRLAELLVSEHQADVVATETSEAIAHEAMSRFGSSRNFQLVSPDELFERPCDIFAPCAFGSVLNQETIRRLRCSIVAGAANNQLADEERDNLLLEQRGIFYAVDYVINSGGLIHVAQDYEAGGHWTPEDDEKVRDRASKIYDTVKRLIKVTSEERTSPSQAAMRIARDILQSGRLPADQSPHSSKQ